MRDWARYEKAKKLRDSGMTFKRIGFELGVCAQRARDIVRAQERKEAELAAEAKDATLIPWYRGLKGSTIRNLLRRGFYSKDDCRHLCGSDLTIYRGAIALPGWEPCSHLEWNRSDKRILVSVVNDVRAWLGVEPFVPQPRQVTAAELERAKQLLQSHGYKVVSVDGGH